MPLVSKTFADIITFTRASTANYFNSAGVLTNAAAGEPRFDYNPATLAAQGLLIEEQRTNSIRNNTMVGAVAGTPGTLPTNWATVGAGLGTLTQTIVATGTSAGISYIDVRISGTTSTNSFGISFEQTTQISAASGQTWTSSIYLARVGGTTSNLTVSQRVVERSAVGVGLANTSSNVTSSLGTSLLRFSATTTLTNAATAFITTDVLFDFLSGVAIDITLRIGLPQLEQGAFATSVIPTTTIALTRVADVASVNTLSPWYNASEGTLYAEGSRIAAGLTSGVIAGFAQTLTFNQSMYIANDIGTGNGLSMSVINGGVAQASVGGTVTTGITNTFKAALAYAANNFAGSINGATPVTDTSGTVPTPMQNLTIGSAPWQNNGSTNWSGYLRRISYYPRRLSNAELQTITT